MRNFAFIVLITLFATQGMYAQPFVHFYTIPLNAESIPSPNFLLLARDYDNNKDGLLTSQEVTSLKNKVEEIGEKDAEVYAAWGDVIWNLRRDPSLHINFKKQAIKLYQKAADAGSTMGMCRMAQRHMKGTYGVSKNYRKAYKYLQKAAEAKDPEAAWIMAHEFCVLLPTYGSKKEQKSCPVNNTIKVEWYQKCAEWGKNMPISAAAFYNLALCYGLGQGVDKDDRKSTYLFYEAAIRENREYQIEALKMLCNKYEIGRGVPQSYIKTIFLQQALIAAQKNDYKKVRQILDTNFFDLKPFSQFADEYVNKELKKWQQKGEFETTSEWKERVNEENSKIKIKEFYSQTRHVFIEKGENLEKNNAKIAEYNADEEAFKIITSSFGIWLMPVPLAEAPHFKEKNTFEKKLVVCNIENDHITLEKLAFQTKDGRIFSCHRP